MRSRAPLMPFSIFRLRTLRGADTVALLIGMSLFSMFFFISLYMQQVLQLLGAARRGLLPAAGRRDHPLGGRGVCRGHALWLQADPVSLGFCSSPPGCTGSHACPGTGARLAADILGPSVLAAIGLGLSFVPVTIAAVTGTRPQEAGLASGLVNTAQQVGGALGLAILATIANSRTQRRDPRRPAQRRDRTDEGL